MKIAVCVAGLYAWLLLAVCLCVPANQAYGDEKPPLINEEYAFTARVQLGEPLTVDQVPNGTRRYIPITGGSVSGPHFKGAVVAAGGDSQLIRADGVLVVEASYVIKTEDNVLISVLNRGLRRATPAVMARLMKGEHVAREDYYFRTVAQFEAPLNSRYADMNGSLYLATAEREANMAIVHFYRVL